MDQRGAGIFHAFHPGWIVKISDALNAGLLPDGFHALPEQLAGRIGPDVLTLQAVDEDEDDDRRSIAGGSKVGGSGLLLAEPELKPIAETETRPLCATRIRRESLVFDPQSDEATLAKGDRSRAKLGRPQE